MLGVVWPPGYQGGYVRGFLLPPTMAQELPVLHVPPHGPHSTTMGRKHYAPHGNNVRLMTERHVCAP